MWASSAACSRTSFLACAATTPAARTAQRRLSDRFLFSIPPSRRATKERWRTVSAETRQHWAGVVDRLLDLRPVQEGKESRPYLMKLTGSGETGWEAFTEVHAAELNDPEFPEPPGRPVGPSVRLLRSAWPLIVQQLLPRLRRQVDYDMVDVART